MALVSPPLAEQEGNMLDLSGKKEEPKGSSKPLITQKTIKTGEIEQSVHTLVLIVLILVAVIAAGFYVFKVYRSSQLNHQEAVYDDLLTQLNSKNLAEIDKTAIGLQEGLEALKGALGKQLDYSKILGELQKTTPKNVQLNNFSVSEKDEIKVDGEADDYTAVAETMASFGDSELFSNIVLVSSTTASTNEGKVSFALTMKLNKNKLK